MNYKDEYEKLAVAIRNHRDQRGDDRCFRDDYTLYSILPEGYKAPSEDTCVQLELCKKYIASRQNPNTIYISPQRRIEELEQKVIELETYLEVAYEELAGEDY